MREFFRDLPDVTIFLLVFGGVCLLIALCFAVGLIRVSDPESDRAKKARAECIERGGVRSVEADRYGLVAVVCQDDTVWGIDD